MNPYYKPIEGRFTAKKKHQIMLHLKNGLITPSEAKQHYNMSDYELMKMAHAYNTRGQDGLKVRNTRPV